MHEAAWNGYSKCVEFLATAKCNVNIHNRVSLYQMKYEKETQEKLMHKKNDEENRKCNTGKIYKENVTENDKQKPV